MATNWDSEMQDRFDKMQTALTEGFRTQFEAMGAGLEDRLGRRLRDDMTTMGTQLEDRLGRRLRDDMTTMGAELEDRLGRRLRADMSTMGAELDERLYQRLDERLGSRLNVQAEQLREIVQTAADNYGGVLDGIKRELTEFRGDWRKETEDTRRVLANHGGRITAIEKTLSGG